MGTWSASIMGNDTAMDLKDNYKAAFCYYSPEKAIKILDSYYKKELGKDEIFIYYYSVAQFMWEHGILTAKVKDRAIEWINGKKGLELYAEQGISTLQKRKAVLEKLKKKLNSPMPAKKEIKQEPYTMFEIGDLIAVQLKTYKDAQHLSSLQNETITAQLLNKYDGYYVVVKKIYDRSFQRSSIVPEAKDAYPMYVLYDYLDKKLPDNEDIKKMKIVRNFVNQHPANSSFIKSAFEILEKTEFEWKKRNYKIIGNDLSDCQDISKEVKRQGAKSKSANDFFSAFTNLKWHFDSTILRCLISEGIINDK